MKDVNDARQAWEAAKTVHTWFNPGQYPSHAQLKSLAAVGLTTATAAYETALLADAQREMDALGIKVGETVVAADGVEPFIIIGLEADVAMGSVKALSGIAQLWAWADEISPYTAPEVKNMVLTADSDAEVWMPYKCHNDRYRITLSGITPADLDTMTGTLTGTYTVEKL